MKRLAVLLMLLVAFTSLKAQEVCNNGKDDDGDGFIDCYDRDCSVSTFCKDFYLGEDAQCEVTPPAFPQFTMALDFASPNETTNHLSRMAIGDLNRDGKPEIITMNRYTDRLFILNGSDGSIQQQATVDFEPQWEIAIANIDNDNCGEIFFYGVEDPPGDNNSTFHLYAYDCNLNLIWRSAALRGEPVNYGLADFDGDGKVELYVKDAIYDAHTGTRIVNSTASNWGRTNGGPVAVDMEGDEKLELVIGCAIYSVDLGDRTLDAGSLTLLKRRSDYYIRNEFNATSVADFNQDGYLDVLASGSTNSHGANTTVFFWDVRNDTIATYSDPIPGDFTIYACPTQTGEYYKNGWKNGTGRINIADLDGDGRLNISYVSGKFLYALNERLEPMSWSPKTVNEETSGYTGCTLFDFNGDGKSEIVYRDERFLYIINGTDGTVYNQQACVSRTNREYPIVADVDADGSTELCVTCGFDDNDAIDNFCDLNSSRYSHVRVFRSASDPWVPARRVWNQHGYFNVNVNDDLTIPIRQQKHHLVFSTGNCTVGPNRPLNGFLNQAPFLNIDGCPTYKSPDLAFVNNSLTVNPPTCPNQNFTVTFQVQNMGDMTLSGDVPITFYNGNPLAAGAIKLNTVTVPLSNLGVDAIHTVTNVTVNGPGGPFTLYIVLNDDGTTVPTPIQLPNTDFLECDYNNNVISVPINPLPVAITALKVQDNIKCSGSSSPNNGAVRAFIPIAGGGENTTSYNFYWSNGTVTKPVPADHTGASVNGLAEGVYTVYAIHKTANCSSASASVTVGRVDRNIQATIVLENPYDNCKNPNGKLRAIVNDTDGDGIGEPPGLFTFAWYEGPGAVTDPQISVSHIATGLKPKTYTVIITEKATGCPTIASFNVIDNSVIPVVTASAVSITCASGNSGSASANVNNTVVGYKFDWYNGGTVKPVPDFSGADYTNLGGGTYTVVATHNSSQCESSPVTVTVTQSAPITVSVIGSTSQTSCDPAQPNGTASANVGGNTLGYSFEWFRGQNTLPANRVSTSANATGLAAGIYTVKATRQSTGCTDTEQVTISNAVVTPTLIVGAVGNQTNCTTPDGRITVNVSLDSPSDYTFSWFNGTTADATPDYPDTDNILDGLSAGTYTVRAVHKTKHCAAAPITATVTDITPATTIVQNSVPKLPTDCNANDGELEVRVNAAGNTLGFQIEWFKNTETTPFATVTGVTVSKQEMLASALYTIRATNLDNGCSVTESFALPFAEAQFLTLVSANPTTTCAPNNEGNLTVELTPTSVVIPGPPPVSFSVNDYVMNFYAGSGTSGTLLESRPGAAGTLNGDGTANYTLSGLTPGFYTIVAVGNAMLGNCPSVPLIVEIKQSVVFPAIATALVDANMNCTGTTGNGRIDLNIDGVAPESDYDYAWHEGADATAPLLGVNTGGSTSNGGATALGLPGGLFTVEVTNRATACRSVATIQILDNPPVISIPAASLDITHVTFCDMMSGGAASVSDISEGTGTVPVTDYTFAWFDVSQNILPNAGAPNTSNSINGLVAGTYYVRATRTAGTAGLNCASAMVAFEIEDRTVNTINVKLTSFTKPTRCLKPANVQGALTVDAYGGATGTTYSYNWYAGTTASGAVQFNGPAFTGISIPAGQTSVTYTLEATNNMNHCTIRETYTLPLEVAPVNISASSAPVTFCAADNGAVFATVTNGSFDYSYHWDSGNTVTQPGDYTGKGVENLAVGNYTVIAVDVADTFCQSPAATVTIDDGRIYPVVSATALAPLTICDPARPDGVARATVSGDFVNYDFDWFLGNPPTGTAMFSGAEAGNLTAATYTVVATHIVTGCSSTATVAIDRVTVPIPIPQVELVSNVTSCAADNGALAASVNGNTGDFIFHWYLADPGTPADTASSSYHGEIYSNLSEGHYYVSATSRLTGCISGPANGDIIEAPVYPDFDFRVTPASCGLENGFLAIYMLNDTDIASVVWTGNGITVTEPSMQGIPAGYYSVTVTSALGCPTTKDIEVKTEIRPFNGVSRNIDSKNDIFLINCIDEFPNNLVKIFNRAGTLVYEATGYDNVGTYFDGKSNKGLSLMGNNLPDGTYFYIIDKRDGSKPMAGYLEVVN